MSFTAKKKNIEKKSFFSEMKKMNIRQKFKYFFIFNPFFFSDDILFLLLVLRQKRPKFCDTLQHEQ
jgi:hypothetical protein